MDYCSCGLGAVRRCYRCGLPACDGLQHHAQVELRRGVTFKRLPGEGLCYSCAYQDSRPEIESVTRISGRGDVLSTLLLSCGLDWNALSRDDTSLAHATSGLSSQQWGVELGRRLIAAGAPPDSLALQLKTGKKRPFTPNLRRTVAVVHGWRIPHRHPDSFGHRSNNLLLTGEVVDDTNTPLDIDAHVLWFFGRILHGWATYAYVHETATTITSTLDAAVVEYPGPGL